MSAIPHGMDSEYLYLKTKRLRLEDAVTEAGLAWDVELRPLLTQDAQGKSIEILDNRYVTFRISDDRMSGIV